MKTVLAGDLGGTKCRFALVDEQLGVHGAQWVATVRERTGFLREMDAAIGRVLGSLPPGAEPPGAAGFGVAGLISPDGNEVVEPPNLPLDRCDLGRHVAAAFGLRTALLNDGRASAWGEFLRGHAAGDDPLLCLFFGTGIGIGLIAGGAPYRGAANAAGEIGHTIHVPDGRPCPCGGLGHFEAYCGGRAITERAAADLGKAPAGNWTVGAVVQVAAAGGSEAARAARILVEAEAAAGALVANACTLLNPRACVLGGGVLEGWPDLFDRVVAQVRRTTRRAIHGGLRFVRSLGGSDAILWGAAAATGALDLRPPARQRPAGS